MILYQNICFPVLMFQSLNEAIADPLPKYLLYCPPNVSKSEGGHSKSSTKIFAVLS